MGCLTLFFDKGCSAPFHAPLIILQVAKTVYERKTLHRAKVLLPNKSVILA
jgi:hypothetical protein